MNFEPKFGGDAHLVDIAEADARKRRRLRWTIIALAALGLAIGAYFLFRGKEEAAPAAPSLPRVTVIVPGRQTVPSLVTATGSIAARREMPVGVPGEGGLVARVLVEPGDWARAGQPMAVIDRSVQTQQASQLAAQIQVARADAALAEADLRRAQALVSRGFISKADIDRRIATRDAANARVRLAQAQLGERRARIGQLDVRAPEGGLVLARSVEPGQVVGPSSGTLFRVARGGEMELLAQVAEQDLASLRVGMPVEVTPVGSARTFRGQIWQLSPVVDPETRQGTARIALRYDTALRPGGFASARIAGGAVDAPLLPESAVQSDEKGNFVFVIAQGNVVARRDVKIGEVSDAGVPIVSGLSGNERVVLSAAGFLNPGEKVSPVRAAAPR